MDGYSAERFRRPGKSHGSTGSCRFCAGLSNKSGLHRAYPSFPLHRSGGLVDLPTVRSRVERLSAFFHTGCDLGVYSQVVGCLQPWVIRARLTTLSVVFACTLSVSYGPALLAQERDLGTTPATNLSSSGNTVSRYADITADCAGNVHVVWIEEDGAGVYDRSICYSMWDGNTWTEANSIRVAYGALIPSVVADRNGDLHLLYLSGNLLWHSRTRGTAPWSARSWSAPIAISEPLNDENQRWHELVIDEQDNLHVLYLGWGSEGETLRSEAYYVQSPDGGQTWSSPTLLSSPGVWAGLSGTSNWLAADQQGGLYAVWGEEHAFPAATTAHKVLFARSQDGGVSWTAPLLMSEPAIQPSEPLAIVSDGRGTLHLLWHRGQNEIVHQRSRDQGQTWTEPYVIFKGDQDISRYGKGSAAVDSRGWLHVVMPLGTQDLYYLVWNGEQWLEPTNVTHDPERVSYWPRLAIAGGNQLHLVWNQGYPELALPELEQRLSRGEYEILHKGILLDAPTVEQTSCRAGIPLATPTPASQEGGPGLAVTATSRTPTRQPLAVSPPMPSGLSRDRPAWAILVGVVSSLILLGLAVVWYLMRRG